MIKFKNTLLLLIFSVFVFGCVCAGLNNINTPGSFLNTCPNQVNDAKNGYSLCLPQGWKSEIVSNQYLLAEGDNGDSSVIIWPLVLGGEFRSINALQLTNFIVGQVKQEYPDFTVVNISSNSDKTLVQVVATYSDQNNKKFKGVLTTFMDPNGNGFLAGYETLAANFNTREPELREILASYKIVKPESASAAVNLVSYQSQGGEVTLQAPPNWQIGTAGSCAGLAVIARDSQNPVKQMIAFTELGPVYYDPAIKQQSDEYYATCRQLGAVCPGADTIAQLPLVTNVDSERYITEAFPALGTVDLVRQIAPFYPEISNVQIIDRQPLPQDVANLYTQSGIPFDGGTYYATFTQGGIAAKGRFLVVVTYYPVAGFAAATPLYMISAPVDEFDSLEATLVKTAESIKLSDPYVKNCQAQQRAQAEAQRNIANTLSETSDIITKGWEARQETYDRISQKWSDTILSRERVYNPDKGEVYDVSNGFYDYYNTHREEFEFKNMRELTPQEYQEVPLDGRLNIK
ncbi:hypothetical protein HY570_02245 [Candidatus Micrarchaeota archaeon]|nr:hypothetical protein [Candidatus Micrarchaeota archaeon]